MLILISAISKVYLKAFNKIVCFLMIASFRCVLIAFGGSYIKFQKLTVVRKAKAFFIGVHRLGLLPPSITAQMQSVLKI
jgi:hypothetical protein